MHSDLHDLALWDENFYTGKVGGRALVDTDVRSGPAEFRQVHGLCRGPQRLRSRAGSRWVTHGGSWVGYRSSIVRVPGEHFSVIVLCNRADADAGGYAAEIARDLARRQARSAGCRNRRTRNRSRRRSPAEWDPGDLSRYAGAYSSEEADVRCVLDQRGAALVLEGCAQRRGPEARQAGRIRRRPRQSASCASPPGGKDADSFIYWSPGLRGLPFKQDQGVVRVNYARIVLLCRRWWLRCSRPRGAAAAMHRRRR